MTHPTKSIAIFAQNSPRPCLPALGKIVAPWVLYFRAAADSSSVSPRSRKPKRGPTAQQSVQKCAKMHLAVGASNRVTRCSKSKCVES